ncbi:hypothetical protein MTBGP_09680 [Moorella thermoacetica]|uniref:phage tail assembly protein n=1 Tax=Neomoorella thermoacetica TaxID=1525 RepID=UPI0030D0E9F4
MEIKLQKPFVKDGKTIEKLTLNLEAITGNDLIKAEKVARALGEEAVNPLFTQTGLAVVAAQTSGLTPDDILELSAPDFLLVVNTVYNFLFGWVLSAAIQSKI